MGEVRRSRILEGVGVSVWRSTFCVAVVLRGGVAVLKEMPLAVVAGGLKEK